MNRILVWMVAALAAMWMQTADAVTVDDRLPAGNAVFERIEGDQVFLRQDFRGMQKGEGWFYWAFRVTGAAGRTLTFNFTAPYGGGPVGVRGPVVSLDRGKTYAYPLDGKTTRKSFTYAFPTSADEVWFYECHPYLQTDWDAFLARHAAARGKAFETGVLCKSKRGRDVEKGVFGCLREPKRTMLVSARHHCSESVASYVLEGFLEAVLAADEVGEWYRANVAVMAVPFMDKDGCEEGEQGKNRAPHDHNRDYTEFVHPETKATVEWIKSFTDNRLEAWIDFHCPWIRGNYNEFIYSPLKRDVNNRNASAELRFDALVEKLQAGGLNYKASDDLPYGKAWNNGGNYKAGWSAINWAIATLPEIKLGHTFEIPFANANGAVVTPNKCRAFGRSVAAAWRAFALEQREPLLKSGDRLCFMGDSITELGSHDAGYANLVKCALDDAGIAVVQLTAGVSGEKSNDMLRRFDKDVVARKATWLTLSCGVNDVWHQDMGKGVSLDDYKANMRAMLDKAKAAGVKTLLFTATAIGEDPKDPRNARAVPYNAFLREEAKARDLPLIDFNAIMFAELKKGRLTLDGVHMNPAGNLMMATNVLNAFRVPYDLAKLTRLSKLGPLEISEERAQSLVKVMTLEEKAGELMLYDYKCWGTNNWNVYREHVDQNRIGALMRVRGQVEARKLQEYKMAHSRLGIPMIFHDDITHGYRTILPVQLGNACSWDEDLVEKAEAMVARETSVSGLQMTYAPMVDLSDDPRWGRICETSGEDPYLSARLTAARVRGFQGRTPAELGDRRHIIACDKHFIGYASLQAAKDYRHRDFSRRELYETYLPPHRAAIEAGALGVMNAYTTFEGVPCNFNRFLMTDLLRDRLGFRGQLMTDWTTFQFSIDEGAATDLADTAVRGLAAGVDMDMIADAYLELPRLVREGKVSEADVDRAVIRSLALKFRMHLFNYPFRYCCNPGEENRVAGCAEHRDVALQLTRESIVLLENDGVLPLDPSKSVGLTGTWADDGTNMLSEWVGEGKGEECVTLKAGLAKRWGERLDFVAAAKGVPSAETVILAIGEKSNLTGERHSRAKLTLPEEELANLRALKAAGKRIVSVVFAGRPIDMTEIKALSSAVLYAWYPGTMGGEALAEILAGETNPSGRLCQHFPKHVGQIPISYREKRTFIVTGYSDIDTAPLYPFGFGRSYTTFAYGKPTVAKRTWWTGEPVEVSVKVMNMGAREGREVVQLYLRDEVASVLPRERELRGFRSVTLKPGEAQDVRFVLDGRELGLYDADLNWVVEPGDFTAFVGPDSTTTNGVTFTVTDAPGVRVKAGEKIAFLGDSITQFGDFPAGYINMVMLGLEKAGVKAEKIPAGISGHKSSDMLKRLERDVLSKKPDWMTLYCGVNDVWHWSNPTSRGCTLDEYRRNVREILDRATAAGIKVILLTPSMISENEKDARNDALKPYADFIRAEAAARGLPLADVSKALWHEVRTAPTRKGHVGSKVTGDGVHMSWYGDRVIAREILKHLGVGEKESEAAAQELRTVRGGRYWFGFNLDDEQRADLAARAQKRGMTFDNYVYEKMMGTIGPDGNGKGKVKTDPGAKYHRIGVSFARFEELEDLSNDAGKPLAVFCLEELLK